MAGSAAITLADRELTLERARAVSSLWVLATEYLGYDKLSESFHKPMLAEWDRLDERRIASLRKLGRVPLVDDLAVWPREHIKTWLMRARVIRYYLAFPSITVIGWHAVEEIMQESCVVISKHLQFTKELRRLFPPGVLPAMNSKRFIGAKEFRLAANRVGDAPSFRAYGAGSEATGGHSVVGWLDDPVGYNDLVDSQFPKKKQWYQATVCGVVRKDVGWKIASMTRWDREDLAAHFGTLPSWQVRTRSALETDGRMDYEGKPVYLTAAQVQKARREMGDFMFCTPTETPILMADWSLKSIGQVVEGDRIMGFSLGDSRKALKAAIVTKTGSLWAPLVKVTMASGETIRSTPEHKWLTGKQSTAKAYRPARLGRALNRVLRLSRLGEVRGDALRDWAWLAGMVDGEGSCGGSRSSLVVHQDSRANPEVCREIEAVLGRLGIAYHRHERRGRPSSRMYLLHGGRQLKLQLLRYGRPAKSAQILAGMRTGQCFEQDRVVAIQDDGEGRVHWLTTETGNYIAWGYGSSNSLQMQNDDSPVGEKPWIPEECERSITDEEAAGPGLVVVISDPAPAKLGSGGAAETKARDGEKNWWVTAAVKFRRRETRREAVLLEIDGSRDWGPSEGFERIVRMGMRWGARAWAVEKTGQATAFYTADLERAVKELGSRMRECEDRQGAKGLASTFQGKNPRFRRFCDRAKYGEFLIARSAEGPMLDMALDQCRRWRPLDAGFRNGLRFDDGADCLSYITDPVWDAYVPPTDAAAAPGPIPSEFRRPLPEYPYGGRYIRYG